MNSRLKILLNLLLLLVSLPFIFVAGNLYLLYLLLKGAAQIGNAIIRK